MENSAPKQVPPHAPISPARAAAFAILDRVATTSAHSDDLLHGPGMSALSQADRNLATALVLGVLRWQIALDARMQPLLQRPDLALPTPVATALRMGAFQLQHLDRIPAHAALSESVELVRAAGHGHASGMVNAILRKLTREPIRPQPRLYETTAVFAQRLAHPDWLVSRWVRTYGRTATLAICAYNQQEPHPGTLFTPPSSPNAEPQPPTGSSDPQPAPNTRLEAQPAPTRYPELQPDSTAHPEARTAPTGSPQPQPAPAAKPEAQPPTRYPEAGSPRLQPWVSSGLIAQQEEGVLTPAPTLPHIDDGSRLVAELAAAVHPSPRRIWDCCAAPGGKTLILAYRHPSADLLASDANPRRLQALAARLHAAAPHARTLEADATHLPDTEPLFDLILCDVPCSGTGTLGRNPEIKLRLVPSDLARQATRQRQILSAALARLAPGGRLLYSTCSLEPEENEDVVAAVLAALPPDTEITVTTLEPALTHLTESGILALTPSPESSQAPPSTTVPNPLLRNGRLRTLPGATLQADGFFAALFHRV